MKTKFSKLPATIDTILARASRKREALQYEPQQKISSFLRDGMGLLASGEDKLEATVSLPGPPVVTDSSKELLKQQLNTSSSVNSLNPSFVQSV